MRQIDFGFEAIVKFQGGIGIVSHEELFATTWVLQARLSHAEQTAIQQETDRSETVILSSASARTTYFDVFQLIASLTQSLEIPVQVKHECLARRINHHKDDRNNHR